MSTHKPNPDYMAKAATPFDIALAELCARKAVAAPDDSGAKHVPDVDNAILQTYVDPLPVDETLSATDPRFLEALAHVREKAGPMLARLAKR